ncbi:hypothetical protein EVG20_g10512 [Dentipellis fragilis]|uniref:Uncharacterized protein n=1 Tax=Dentipellis fragilis TaxID=205917 RepID=A0A4Y9XQE4_9AGAM|nr:hypothetical protein EVG20_g10512 [Dentipellis fragilis]
MDSPARFRLSVEHGRGRGRYALPGLDELFVERDSVGHLSLSTAVELSHNPTFSGGSQHHDDAYPLHTLLYDDAFMIPASCCPCIRNCICNCHLPATLVPLYQAPPSQRVRPPVCSPLNFVDTLALPASTIPSTNISIPEFSHPIGVTADAEQSNIVPIGTPEAVPQTYRQTAAIERRFGLTVPAQYISFRRSDGTDEGVRLIDMLARDFSVLADADAVVLGEHACQIMLQVGWPGYKTWSKPLRTRVQKDRTSVSATRGTIARRVALRMQLFINEAQEDDALPARWAVGPSGIRFEQIILRRLV